MRPSGIQIDINGQVIEIVLTDDVLALALAAIAPRNNRQPGAEQRKAAFHWADKLIADWHVRYHGP